MVHNLSVPWSLRPQNRAAAGRCEHRCGYRNLRRRFFCWVCDWYAGSRIGHCDGVQSYPQDIQRKFIPIGCFEHGAQLLISGLKTLAPSLKNRTRLASFWRFSGDFSAAADPKLTCLCRGSVLSCLRRVIAQAFATNPLGKLPKITRNNCKLRSYAKLRSVVLSYAKLH